MNPMLRRRGLTLVTLLAISAASACGDGTAPRLPTSIQAASATLQSAIVGTAVGDPPAVVVRDANGNPWPGIPVSFLVSRGGGQVTPVDVITGADGIARVQSWVVGAAPDTNVVTTGGAVAGGVRIIHFTAIAIVDPASP